MQLVSHIAEHFDRIANAGDAYNALWNSLFAGSPFIGPGGLVFDQPSALRSRYRAGIR
jgi:hypothetical protein